MSVIGIGYLIGAGSFTLGVEAAGVDVKEIWETPGYSKNAATWDLNRPMQRHWTMELDHTNTALFASRVQEHRRAGDFVVGYGNPPCGGLSAMTCSRIESPTNTCMRQWIRMMAPAGFDAIIMENAYQLATDRMQPLLKDLESVLELHGYWYWTWMFYSYQVGTPQIRRRMFLLATKEKPVNESLIQTWDLERYHKYSSPSSFFLESLRGVEPSPYPVRDSKGVEMHQHGYGWQWCYQQNELVKKWWERLQYDWVTPEDYQKACDKANTTGDPKDIRKVQKDAEKVWWDCPKSFKGMSMQRPYIVPWTQACQTIIGNFKYIHPYDQRLLTMRELARLMGYPDNWNFHRLEPHLIAQGIPVNNAWWATDRILRVAGVRS